MNPAVELRDLLAERLEIGEFEEDELAPPKGSWLEPPGRVAPRRSGRGRDLPGSLTAGRPWRPKGVSLLAISPRERIPWEGRIIGRKISSRAVESCFFDFSLAGGGQ